jgi:hypothetical protein
MAVNRTISCKFQTFLQRDAQNARNSTHYEYNLLSCCRDLIFYKHCLVLVVYRQRVLRPSWGLSGHLACGSIIAGVPMATHMKASFFLRLKFPVLHSCPRKLHAPFLIKDFKTKLGDQRPRHLEHTLLLQDQSLSCMCSCWWRDLWAPRRPQQIAVHCVTNFITSTIRQMLLVRWNKRWVEYVERMGEARN